jgi:hypothetical protein
VIVYCLRASAVTEVNSTGVRSFGHYFQSIWPYLGEQWHTAWHTNFFAFLLDLSHHLGYLRYPNGAGALKQVRKARYETSWDPRDWQVLVQVVSDFFVYQPLLTQSRRNPLDSSPIQFLNESSTQLYILKHPIIFSEAALEARSNDYAVTTKREREPPMLESNVRTGKYWERAIGVTYYIEWTLCEDSVAVLSKALIPEKLVHEGVSPLKVSMTNQSEVSGFKYDFFGSWGAAKRARDLGRARRSRDTYGTVHILGLGAPHPYPSNT